MTSSSIQNRCKHLLTTGSTVGARTAMPKLLGMRTVPVYPEAGTWAVSFSHGGIGRDGIPVLAYVSLT
jgi:hypothetical protein